MAFADQLRRQFEDGVVWTSKETVDPHDDVCWQARSDASFRARLCAALPGLFESSDARHLTGAVAVLGEVEKELGAATLRDWLEAHGAKLHATRPAWRIGVEDLQLGLVQSLARVVTAADATAVAWLKAWATLHPERALDVTAALASFEGAWLVQHAALLARHDHLVLLERLPDALVDDYIRVMAPWPAEKPTFMTQAFWKRMAPERAARLRAAMWPAAQSNG